MVRVHNRAQYTVIVVTDANTYSVMPKATETLEGVLAGPVPVEIQVLDDVPAESAKPGKAK